MAKPPKDPTNAPGKPAARRAPRNAAAKPAARRAAAPPAPAPTAAPTPAAAVNSKAEQPKAATSAVRKPRAPRAPATASAPAKAARTAAPSRAAPSRAKPARPAPAKAPKGVAGPSKAWTIGAIVAAASAGLAAFLTRGRIAALVARDEGHVPTDLLHPDRDGPVKHGDERAPEAFRPDMDAPMTPAEREALRPATGPAPTLASDRGTLNAQTGPET